MFEGYEPSVSGLWRAGRDARAGSCRLFLCRSLLNVELFFDECSGPAGKGGVVAFEGDFGCAQLDA